MSRAGGEIGRTLSAPLSAPLSTPLSPSLALLVASARWPRDGGTPAQVRSRAAAIADWPGFVAFTRRHRMAGMALSGLTAAGVALPPNHMVALTRVARTDLHRMLLLVSEAQAIAGLLAAQGIVARSIKGPALAMLAYGELGVRQCRDLDLLIAPADLSVACRLLRAAGYRQVAPAQDDEAALATWLRLRKDIGFISPRHGLFVELHARLVDSHGLLAAAPEPADFAPVTLSPGVTLATLSGDYLLLYLCIHGARHGWVRLKWLADVAALLRAGPPEAIERLSGLAAHHGAVPHVGQALLLCHRLFGLALPPALAARFTGSRRLGLLERLAIGFIDHRLAPGSRRFGNTQLSAYEFLLTTTPRQFGDHALSTAADVRLAMAWGGSPAALLASVVARPFAWSWRKLTGSDVIDAATA